MITAKHSNVMLSLLAGLLSGAILACTEDDPQATPSPDSGTPDTGDAGDAGGATDTTDAGEDPDAEVPDTDATVEPGTSDVNDTGTGPDSDADTVPDADAAEDTDADAVEPDPEPGFECERPASDFTPGADDDWPTCSPDSGEYVRFQESVSTIARIDAYEQMAVLLWDSPDAPTPDDFIAARELYATDEGLGSRVSRREDEHYPPVTNSEGTILLCRDEGVPALDPDRCVGPAKIVPLINDAFAAGITGTDPEINAAQLDAALVWFLYASTYKEGVTCTTVKRDCDSSWAYFAGGTQSDEAPRGLARLFDEAEALSYEITYDGVLAVRCWRDNDSADTATDLVRRDQALDQLDRGLDGGMAAIVVKRATEARTSTGVQRQADWLWIQIVAGALDRALGEVSPTAASALRDALAQTDAASADLDAVIDAVQALYPCQP